MLRSWRKKVHNEWHTTAWIANKKRCKNQACNIWKHRWLCIRNISASDPDTSPNSSTHSAKMQLHSTFSQGLCLDVGTSWSLDTVFISGPFNSKTHCYVSHVYIYIYISMYNINRYVYRLRRTWMILCDYTAICARNGKCLSIYKYMHKLHPWDSKPPSHHPVTLQACAPNNPFLLLQLMPPWQLFWDLRHLGLDVSRKLYNRWPTAMIGSLTYLFAISLPVLKERMSLPAKW